MAVIIKNITKGDKYYKYHDLVTGIELEDGGISVDLSDATVYPDLSGIIKDIQKGTILIYEDTLGRFGGRTSASKAVVPVSGSSPYTVNHNLGVLFPSGVKAYVASGSATAGTSTSGSSPSTNISAGDLKKFNIWVDFDKAGTKAVSIVLTSANSGSNIASALQTAIQALGGVYAAVTVAYGSSVYKITSGTTGPGSRVIVTSTNDSDVASALKLGVANGGTEVSGYTNTYDYVNITAFTVSDANSLVATTAATVDHIVVCK